MTDPPKCPNCGRPLPEPGTADGWACQHCSPLLMMLAAEQNGETDQMDRHMETHEDWKRRN